MMKSIIPLMLLLLLTACASTGVTRDRSLSEQYIKAETAYAQRDFSVAKQHYQAIIDEFPGNADVLFKLANISMREKQWDKAAEYYHIILRLQPNYAKAHHNLAMLYLLKASNHFNYYIAHNDSLNNRAMAKLLQAITDYSKHNPDKKTSLDRLADIVKN